MGIESAFINRIVYERHPNRVKSLPFVCPSRICSFSLIMALVLLSTLADGINCVFSGPNNATPPVVITTTSACSQTTLSSASVSSAASLTPDPAQTPASNPAATPAPTPAPAPAPTPGPISSGIISEANSGNSTLAGQATSTASAHQKGKGLAGGAVAGVAIGMLIAGALIAGLVFFFLLHRQKKRQAISATAYTRQQVPCSERSVRPEKGATAVAAPVGSIDDLLPQPAEDDAITGDLSKIRDNIKNHVRTYYHSGQIPATEVNDAGIREIATLTGVSAAVFVNALSNPSTRDNALRSIVASVILTRCTGERSPSLLPGELAGLITSIQVNNENNCKSVLDAELSSTNAPSAAQSVLFSKWKTITGALLQQRSEKQSQDPGRAQSFQHAITSLDSVLAPFVKGSVDGGQRRKNLDMILTRAANLAFLLFAQPGSFRFDFASRHGGLTVFPALVQIFSDQGQPLSPVKVLTEKEVVAA